VANRVNGYPTTAVEAVSSGVSQKTAPGIIRENLADFVPESSRFSDALRSRLRETM
jgi:hypothetical protein